MTIQYYLTGSGVIAEDLSIKQRRSRNHIDQLEETVAHDCYVIGAAAAIVIVGNQ